jgi:hypothetical protein
MGCGWIQLVADPPQFPSKRPSAHHIDERERERKSKGE